MVFFCGQHMVWIRCRYIYVFICGLKYLLLCQVIYCLIIDWMIGNSLKGRNYEGVTLLSCKAALIGTYQHFGTACLQLTTNQHCITSQKSKDLIYTTSEARNLVKKLWIKLRYHLNLPGMSKQKFRKSLDSQCPRWCVKNHLLYTSQKFTGGITWLYEWIGNVKLNIMGHS